MQMTQRTHARVPKQAGKGEIIRIKAKINHPMEPGWRKGADGKPVQRNLIKAFFCLYNGRKVFSADFDSGIAADPYLAFYVRATESGTFRLVWVAENGEKYEKSARIEVV